MEEEIFTYKLYVYYEKSKSVRYYYFDSIFSLYRFMYKKLKNQKVDSLKVVKI